MFSKNHKAGLIILIVTFIISIGYIKNVDDETSRETTQVQKIKHKATLEMAELSLKEKNKSSIQTIQKAKATLNIEEELEWDSWYKAYKAIINEWTLIEKFDDSGEIGYLKFYFDQSYGFDSYWLCDVDDNKVPELFLHSSSMNITAVLTYDKQPLIVLSTRIYGINEETGEIIEMGHWHGAGGSGTEYECAGWKIMGDHAEETMYIDFYDFSENGDFISEEGNENFYVIYNAETGRCDYTTNGAVYNEIYTTHVAPCTLIEDYQLYTLDDLSGLDKAWQENGGNNNILQTLNVDLEDAELIVTDCRYSAMQWGYTDIEAFLKDFGFDNAKPFYQYYEEDSGELQLELYYDEKTGRGCGIRYYPGDGRNPEGFAFNGSDKHTYESSYEVIKERVNADPYNILAKGEVDLTQDKDIKDFEEELEYTSDGRLKHYESQGWITYIGEEKEIQKLLEITLTYREDGTLKQRDYFHNTFALETWYSVVHSFYDKQERLLYEDCYITHGSMDYYYIYDGEEKVPSYCLIMDHNLNLLCVELLSIHDIIANEDGKQYGVVGPDLSDNFYVKVVREAGGYETDKISHTYENDYDDDGYCEAFVIIGDYRNFWGEVTEDQIHGDAWVVDNDRNPTYLETASFRAWQEYIRQDGKTYLFLHHDIGLPWETDIYMVQENNPVICEEYPGSKHLNEDGQVIQIGDTYDWSFNTSEEYGWSGHTWKPYTFEFDQGKLKEISAKEVTGEEVKEMAALPDTFDEKEYESVQYILRENGELNINVAKRSEEFDENISFEYFTCYVNENGEWEITDEGPGIYRIQLCRESHWDYLDRLETVKD